MKKLLLLSFFIAFNASAARWNLQDLIAESKKSSPLLKVNQGKISYAEAAKVLANSYYFPVFNFTQRYTESDNPVQAFGMKLMREDFTMQDFAIDKLNNPDKTKAHQSSFTLYVPIDIGGAVGAQKQVAQEQKEAAVFEGQWIKKEIKKNLTALYHGYFSLEDLQRFFYSEKEFLGRIVKNYDSKSEENKNRYLSYNQARIILDSLVEGVETLENEKRKILKDAAYLAGVEQVEFERQEKKDENFKELSTKEKERLDLRSMESYLKSLDAQISKDRRAYVPELSLFGQYNLSNEKFGPSGAGKDTTVGAQLSWSFGLYTVEKVSLSQAQRLMAQYEYEDRSRRVQTEMETQFEELDKIETSLKHKENRHSIFAENKKILNFQYQRGSVELYNLLDNFISYVQNYSDYMKLKAEYQMKLALYAQNFKE